MAEPTEADKAKARELMYAFYLDRLYHPTTADRNADDAIALARAALALAEAKATTKEAST